MPLMLLLLGLSAKEAVPLSQALILGGSIVNIIMFVGDDHPKSNKEGFGKRARIDYDVVMMLNPALAAGVTVGVTLHVISPSWIIVLCLLVTLVLAFDKSYKKGLQQW